MAEFQIGVLINVTAETAAGAYAQVAKIMEKKSPVDWESTDEWLTWTRENPDCKEVDLDEVCKARAAYSPFKGATK